jgi:hypothetical protein
MKKALVVFLALFSVLAFVPVTFAANQATVTVTSEPIPQGSSCDKAGGFTMEFDPETVLAVGDQITIDLPLSVSLCKNIDLEISADGSDNQWTGNLVDGNDGAAGNVPATGAPLLDPIQDSVAANGGVYFRVFGTAGFQRVTVNVLGNTGGTLTVGSDPDSKLILTFLTQEVNDFPNQNGIFIDGTDNDGIYETDATKGDNTYCINASDYEPETVNVSLDSRNDKFTFIPSNPQVAHLINPRVVTIEHCKGDECGRVFLGESPEQQTGTCTEFDYEDGNGYCSPQPQNRLIIRRTDKDFNVDDYTVTMTILVNGVSGDNGVYFVNEAMRAEGYAELNEGDNGVSATGAACDDPYDPDTYLDTNFYLASGSAATFSSSQTDPCVVPSNWRAVQLVTEASDFGLADGDDFLRFDIPAFRYDLSSVEEGDEVSVLFSVNIPPCTTTYEGEICIATLGCESPEPVAQTYTLTFPYFTAMDAAVGVYWDGLAVTNLSGAAGTFSARFYEMDGDKGTFTYGTEEGDEREVAAHGMFVTMLSAILPDIVPDEDNEGTLGDSRCYIVVTTNFAPDGFAMISDSVIGMSQGYLPRVSD